MTRPAPCLRPVPTLLDAALDYAARKWPVLPLYGVRQDGRCKCGKAECKSPGKHPIPSLTLHGLKDASTKPETIRGWWKRWPHGNVGLVTGGQSGIVVIDLDGEDGFKAFHNLANENGGVFPTVIARTGRGYHLFFRHPGGEVKSLSAIKGRKGLDSKGDGGYVVAPPSRHASGKPYLWESAPGEIEMPVLPEWLASLLSDSTGGNGNPAGVKIEDSEAIPEGARNCTLTSLAGTMQKRGMSGPAIEAALLQENMARCKPPLSESEVRGIAASVARYPVGKTSGGMASDSEAPPIETWPDPPSEAAYYGILGETVRAIEPHTESDPVAILGQLLIGFGNLVGGKPYYRVEGTHHHVNEYVVLVGRTAGGRKGTSWDQSRRILAAVEEEWARERIQGGMSSGEGLIDAVRDAREERQPIRERSRVVDYQVVEVDAGVTDKRLLCYEPELARVLKVMIREGSTLSTIIRQAWDGPNLRVMTKKTGAVATGAHISIVAHITADELNRQLRETDAASGFGNRFLWLSVKRARLLPDGGNLDLRQLAPLREKLSEAVRIARGTERMARDREARELWRSKYSKLSSGKPGLLGAMLSRAEAHVLRLSMLYALADSSAMIRRPHLEAAFALWDYSAGSAAFIFGESLGDPTADELLRALRSTPDRTMTRTEISAHFSGNKRKNDLDRALGVLARMGLVRKVPEKSEGRGRPTERWDAIKEGEE